MKIKPREKPHYVNNKEFSLAVVEYVTLVQEACKDYPSVKEAEAAGVEIPLVPDYIAMCFMKISQGLSHKGNFIRYTYREEMVMDAVENCLKAIMNYNLEAATRSGNPNAFAYFTQICWYAFLRRIAKEKKQQDIKIKYISQSGVDTFLDNMTGDEMSQIVGSGFVDMLKGRIDKVKEYDTELKEFAKQEKAKEKEKAKVKKKRVISPTDSDLSEFIE